jgi:hypothetical protein
VTSAVIGDDRRVRHADHLIDQWRRRLATYQMFAHRRYRHIRYQKIGETAFFGSISTEDGTGAARRGVFHSSAHRVHPFPQLVRPCACDKILSIKN